MNIIIAGCGKVGQALVTALTQEGHDIVVIDNDADAISAITNTHDIMSVCGDATDCDALSEAGVDGVRLFVSVTSSDEVNMLSCLIARRMGARHTIARMRKPEYSDHSLDFLRRQLELSVAVNPEQLAAKEIYNILKLPTAVKIEKFSSNSFEMMETKLRDDSAFVGKSLIEIRSKFKANFLVCAVRRGDTAYIPDGNFVLNAGDRIGITAAPAELQKLLKQLGNVRKQAKTAMILGAGKTSYYLAKMLVEAGTSVKIIEKDEEICKQFSHEIPEAVIINGDGADQELLREEGIASVDAFVSLTGTDEQNILISCFALSQNVSKVITKINRNEFLSIAEKLGLDTIVSPKSAVADVLVSYARALQNSMGSKVETLYKLMDGRVEALQFNVNADFRYVDIPLKDLQTKTNILIAGIIRGRRTIIPSGMDVIQKGDKVVVITAGHRLGDLSDIIK